MKDTDYLNYITEAHFAQYQEGIFEFQAADLFVACEAAVVSGNMHKQ